MYKLNTNNSVSLLNIDEENSNQRLDNFLIKILKGVPKSHIYSIIRSGQIRINKKRVKFTYKLQNNDILRIPPINIATKNTTHIPKFMFDIIYEDDFLLIINKPSGIASHGGSGISYGVIEQIRNFYADYKYLELVHRLDKDTSGLLIVAKKRTALTRLHEQIRNNQIEKKYLALAIGNWPPDIINVKLPLIKTTGPNNEKIVKVAENGIYSHSIFNIKENYRDFSLVDVKLKTGRTHQIRVHMQNHGHPIAGDERYGDFVYNKKLKKAGLKRMFLHAYNLNFKHPNIDKDLELYAPLPLELKTFLNKNEKI